MDAMMMRKVILQGIGGRWPISEDALAALMARMPADATPGYVYRAGQNWAGDNVRRAERFARGTTHAQRRWAREERNRAETHAREELYRKAETQFERIASELLAENAEAPRFVPTLTQQLAAVYWHCFRDITADDVIAGLVSEFPGLTRAGVYQWKRRGKKRLLALAPAELREVLLA